MGKALDELVPVLDERGCALLLIRGASESARVNAVMVLIKLSVLVLFVVIGIAGWNANNFADFAPCPGVDWPPTNKRPADGRAFASCGSGLARAGAVDSTAAFTVTLALGSSFVPAIRPVTVYVPSCSTCSLFVGAGQMIRTSGPWTSLR